MVILKYIDLGLIILVCSYMGFYKSKKFSERVKSLKDFKNALNIFKSKIEFTYEPIADIFKQISVVVYQDSENIFKSFCENIDSQDVTSCWNIAVQNSKLKFEKDDREILMMLGKMLGKTDKTGQISEIDLVNKFLDSQILEAEEVKKKNEKLYKTLGVVGGIAVVIILI